MKLSRHKLRKIILQEALNLNEDDKKEGFNRWMEMFTSRKYTFYQILNEEQKKAFRENMNKIYDNSPPVMQRFLDSYMGDSEKIMKKTIDRLFRAAGFDPLV
jgi:hypothetical protein